MNSGVRHDDLRRSNRGLVLRAVRRAGQPSRTDIAAATGLSHSTISAISSDLIGEQVLVEARPVETLAIKRGRPQVALALNPSAGLIVSVVLSLNSLSGAAIDYSGRVLAEETHRPPTLTLDRDALVARTLAVVRDLQARAGGIALRRIVLAIQGIADAESRRLLWSPITPHSDIAFADLLEEQFGVPAAVHNDCNMMAVALRWREPERYGRDFITVLLSQGIGMGMMLKSELFTGTRSSGGEFGHMIYRPGGALCRCGRHGCVEAYAGNYAIARNARGQPDSTLPPADVGDGEIVRLAEAARAADGPERAAFRIAGEALGYGLGNLFSLIDPAPVAFVGSGAAAFDLMEPALRAALAETSGGQHAGSLDFASATDELPLIRHGGAMLALDYVDEDVFAAGLDWQAAHGRRAFA